MSKSKLKNWDVSLPMSGKLFVTVEAESEEDAIEKALNSDLTTDMLEEWEAHEKICEGNVCHAVHWDAEAELAFGEDEEE